MHEFFSETLNKSHRVSHDDDLSKEWILDNNWWRSCEKNNHFESWKLGNKIDWSVAYHGDEASVLLLVASQPVV